MQGKLGQIDGGFLKRLIPDRQGIEISINPVAKIIRRLNEKWSIVGKAEYIRLTGDAGNAPLVRAGTPNMFSASIGLSYRFVTNFSSTK